MSEYIEWSDEASKLFKAIMPEEINWHNPLIAQFKDACEAEATRDGATKVYHEHVQAIARAFIVDAFKSGVSVPKVS